MKIVNGKWVDQYEDPIDERTCSQLTSLGMKLRVLYGKEITYDRIQIVTQLTQLDTLDERALSVIFEQGALNRLV